MRLLEASWVGGCFRLWAACCGKKVTRFLQHTISRARKIETSELQSVNKHNARRRQLEGKASRSQRASI